jgi:hypothetical protein
LNQNKSSNSVQAVGEGVVYLDLDISPPAEAIGVTTAEWLTEESMNAKDNLSVWSERFTAILAQEYYPYNNYL